jgi:hypothetical protein
MRFLPETALCLAAAVTLFRIYDIPITHDVVWQFWVARQLMNGASLYRDVWEINPPLWFWSAIPIHKLSSFIYLPPLRLLVIMVVVAATLSVFLIVYIGNITSSSTRFLTMMLIFWIVIITPIYDFAQREHLALICALPYAALMARRSANIAVPTGLALLVGAMGAYAFALKHYFIVIPVMLEVWLILRSRTQWCAVRPETLMLVAAALLYGFAVVAFAPAFFTDAVPMVKVAYHGYQSTWEMMFSRPWMVFWICLFAFFLTYGGAFGRKANPLVSTLLIVALGFAIAYFVQRKGWLYHSVPITGAAAAALAVRLGMADMRRPIPIIIGLALLSFTVLLPFKTGLYSNFFRGEIDPILTTIPKGQPVFIASSDPMWGWPTVEDHHLAWSSRLAAFWMIPAIAHGEFIGPNSVPLRALARKIQAEAALEVRCSAPALIMFERRTNYIYQPAAFAVRSFFLRDAALRSYLVLNYRELAPTASFYIYRRIASPAPVRAGPECPAFV